MATDRELVDGAPMAAALLDARGRLRAFNRAFGELVSVADSRLEGARLSDLLSLGSTLAKEGGRIDAAVRDGSDRPVRVTLWPIDRERAERLALLEPLDGTATEIVDIDESTMSHLRRAAAQLAHHVKNPIAGVGGALAVLRDRLELGEEDLQIVDQMIDRLEELNASVEQLAQFGRRRMPEYERLSTVELIHRAVGELPADASARFGEPIGENLVVRCDPVLVVSALCSLMTNALEFSPDAGEVATEIRERSGFCEIEVRDSGRGIDAEVQAVMFDAFFTTVPRHLGLGLPMARHIARTHGGDVTCLASGPDGTRMAIRIPSAQESR